MQKKSLFRRFFCIIRSSMYAEWGLLALARHTYSSYLPPATNRCGLFRFMPAKIQQKNDICKKNRPFERFFCRWSFVVGRSTTENQTPNFFPRLHRAVIEPFSNRFREHNFWYFAKDRSKIALTPAALPLGLEPRTP